MIQLTQLTKNYGSSPALKDISLRLKPGQIVGLLGPNGSGKTTLIKILTGLLRDYQGEVSINGKPVGLDSRALISYLPDQTYLADWMNGESAIKLFKDMYQDFD